MFSHRKFFVKLNFLNLRHLCGIMENMNQRHNQAECAMEFVECFSVGYDKEDLSTQFLQRQKNHLFDSQKHHFGHNCNVLPVFGLNSEKYDDNLIKFFPSILVYKQHIELTV